jgi:hypothetical protein
MLTYRVICQSDTMALGVPACVWQQRQQDEMFENEADARVNDLS